ncbi:MAG: tripartite tricarboxylate transporter permease [Peptococcaceae bacterium]
MIEHISLGLDMVLQWQSLLAILFGVTWGIFGGMIPGINSTIAMALILPFTWGMDPVVAMMMLAGVYAGGEYGGSIPAILIGTPGTNAAACTVLDGYELHKQGRTGLALYTSLISSSFGGLIGAAVLILVAVPLAGVALAFGPAEYFSLATVGLTLVCSLGEKNVLKGILAGMLGVLLSTVGFDPFSAVPRFTFGILSLNEGFKMIPLMMGLFAVSEMFKQSQRLTSDSDFVLSTKTDTSFPSWKEIKNFLPFSSLAALAGVVIGAMPGAGATAAAFITYSEAKRWSKNSDSFGQGNPIGVAVPEAANNAVTGGAMVPLLALGIPGSNSTAIMLGALMIHNVTPGPLLFTKSPEIPYGIFVALFIANICMFIAGYFFIKFAIKATSISKSALIAVVITLVFTGSYAYSGEIFDIGVALCFGLLGILMRHFKVPHTATVLGFVLGFIMEANLRRALIVSDGSYSGVIFNSGISSVLFIIAVASVVVSLIRGFRTQVAK